MLEVQLGIHTISVHLLLYNSLFIPSILFNSQAWTNLTEKETNKLQAIQIKVLKKVMRAPSSTCNAFTFLELGIMPIKYEIHRRQLSFLHHIISLGGDDPVRKLLNNMKSLPGQNCWWSNVSKLQKSYSVEMSDEQISTMTKEAYRRIVNKSVKKVALRNLVRECKEKSKTEDLKYNSLELQDYIKTMHPMHAKTIFKCRSKTLDIKSHRKYQYEDLICRGCNLNEENLNHIFNCGEEPIDIIPINNLSKLCKIDRIKLTVMANRVESFINKVV